MSAGLQDQDFEAYAPTKWKSNVFNRERLEVKQRLVELVREAAGAMVASDGSPLLLETSAEHPALWELDEGDHLRYRCPTGHAFSQSSLLLDQGIEAEQALYTAMRAVEERASTLRRLAAHWPERIPGVRRDYEERARDLDRTAGTLRSILAGARL